MPEYGDAAREHVLELADHGGPRGRSQYKCVACGQGVWITSSETAGTITFLEDMHKADIRLANTQRVAEETVPPRTFGPTPPKLHGGRASVLVDEEWLGWAIQELQHRHGQVSVNGH